MSRLCTWRIHRLSIASQGPTNPSADTESDLRCVKLVGPGLRDYTTATYWNPRFKLKFGLTSSFLLSPLSLVSWILDSVQLILSAGVMAIGSQFHVHLYMFLSLVRRSLLADRLSYVNCRTGSQWGETLTVTVINIILFGLAWASSVAHFTIAVFKQLTPKHHAENVNNNKCSYPLGLASRVTQTCIMDLPLNIVWTTAVNQQGQLMHVSNCGEVFCVLYKENTIYTVLLVSRKHTASVIFTAKSNCTMTDLNYQQWVIAYRY